MSSKHIIIWEIKKNVNIEKNFFYLKNFVQKFSRDKIRDGKNFYSR